MRKRLVSIISSFVFLLSVFGNLFVPVSAAVTFSDVDGHWAKDYIYYGVEKGYINGYSDGTFLPDKNVTRAEFSKMINSALGIVKIANNDFYDVEDTEWYYNDVCKAIAAGYINGYNAHSFAPKNNITRQETAVILSRIITNPITFKTISFKDKDLISDWAVSAVQMVYSKGYMTGNDAGNFEPTAILTRGQAAKIIAQLVQGEAIVTEKKTVSSATDLSGRIFVNDVTLNESIGDGNVNFTNCRILGDLSIVGAGNLTVTFDGTVANQLTVSKTSGSVKLIAKGDTNIKETLLMNGAELDSSAAKGDGFAKVSLVGKSLMQDIVGFTGNFSDVQINSSAVIRATGGTLKDVGLRSLATVIVQTGSIDTLHIEKEAANSSVALGQNVTVDTANIAAMVSFTGNGKINTAVQGVAGITYETTPDKITGTITNPTGTLVPEITPANATTGVLSNSNIVLSFSEAIYKIGGGSVTSSYLADTLELHKGSLTGTLIPFTASIGSTKKIVTLTPTETLGNSTKYYMIIPEGTLQNAGGNTNPKSTSYFTTASSSYITASISPQDGTNEVALDSTIKITFDQAVYQNDSASAITPAYLYNDVVELRLGSSTGTKVPFEATISSTKKLVTVTPSERLLKNNIYYVIVKSGSVKTTNGLTVSRTVTSFTTTGATVPAILPENAAVNVASDTDITLSFDEAMYRASGVNLTADYLQSTAIELRKSTTSGTKLTFTASISSDKKTIVITPDADLEKSMKYYVVIVSGSIANAKGTVNEKQTYYFTTSATLTPSITPANAAVDVATSTDIVIAFGEVLYRAAATDTTINSTYIKSNVVELRRGSATGALVEYDATVSTDKKKITIVPSVDLEPNVKYFVIILKDSLVNTSGTKNARFSYYFTTNDVLIPEILPMNADDEVSTKTNISVSFDEIIYRQNGSSLTAAYLEDTAIELRKGSVDGSFVAFTAAISADKKVFTLTPTIDLDGQATYFIIVNRDTLANVGKETNPRSVSSFTTGIKTDASITVMPANNSTGASIYAPIEIRFGSAVYKVGGGTVLSTYLKSNAITLRKRSSSGTAVAFNASMSGDRKSIIITPEAVLDKNTVYYVQINANTLQFSDSVIIPATSSSFTTGDGAPLLSTFTAAEVTATTVEFAMLSDTTGIVTMKVVSEDGDYSETFTRDITKNTTSPYTVSGLKADTKYNVTASITANSITSAEKTLSFTTKSALALTITGFDDDSVKIQVQYGASGTLNISYVNKTTGATVQRLTGFGLTGTGTREFEITGLNQDTEYTVTVLFTDLGGNDSSRSVEFTTNQVADYLSLAKLEIIDGADVYAVQNLNYACSASIERTTSVKIRPTVSDPTKVTITVKGMTVASGSESNDIAVATGGKTDVTIVIKSKDSGNIVTYTLSINVA